MFAVGEYFQPSLSFRGIAGSNCKTFSQRNLQILVKSQRVCGWLFETSLILVCKDLEVRVGSCLTHKQGEKGQRGTNTVAYYEHSLITAVKLGPMKL